MQKKKKPLLTVREMVVFAFLGALMFVSKVMMEALPNIHTVGFLTATYTLVYRRKALIPLYIYVLLNGLLAGFNIWWVPYLYTWLPLWGCVMLLPRRAPRWVLQLGCSVLCTVHGLLFGVLYAPAQAIFFHLDFAGTLAWIAAGFSFDLLHAVGNLALSFLILPMATLIQRIDRPVGHADGEARR